MPDICSTPVAPEKTGRAVDAGLEAAASGQRARARGLAARQPLALPVLVLLASVGLLVAHAADAASRGGAHSLRRAARVAQASLPQPARNSSVLLREQGMAAALLSDAALSRLGYSAKDWLDSHAAVVSGRGQALHCDLCARSAQAGAGAEPGSPTIGPQFDVDAITRSLTTVQIADATVRVTSLSPLGLLFRKPF